VHPQHIVEQESGAVAGRQPLMSETGTAHEHRTQFADLAVHPQRRGGSFLHRWRTRFPEARGASRFDAHLVLPFLTPPLS
jgi:hypothetical protein